MSSSTPIPFSGCTLRVQVADTRIADAAARILGQADYPNVLSFPILYSITYPPDTPPQPYYSLLTRITCSDVLRYLSDTPVYITVGETGVDLADIQVRAI